MNRTLPAHLIFSWTSALIVCLLAPAFCLGDPPASQGGPAAKTEAPAEAAATDAKDAQAKDAQAKDARGAKDSNWKPLKGSWVVSQFGGDGPVEIEENLVKIGFGDPLTGIRWQGEIFRENYELELEARRTDGFDFFCGLTFPVGKDHVSLILGGWGGGVVGISSIDGRDASENETTSFRNFDNEKWYSVRVRVEPNAIRCWIDDKAAAEHVREGHKFDIRYEMDPSVPLGVAAFQCKSELRNMRMRRLTDKEIAEATTRLSEQASEK